MDPNRPFREGEAELARLLRRVDREVRRSEAEAMDLPTPSPGAIPSDVTRAIFQTLQLLWSVRGALLHQAMARAQALFVQGVPPQTAALLAGRELNLPPRRVAPSRPGMSAQQVRQYHRRQQQRGRRPGQDPRWRRGQREAEVELARVLRAVDRAAAEAELEAGRTGEAMARRVRVLPGQEPLPGFPRDPASVRRPPRPRASGRRPGPAIIASTQRRKPEPPPVDPRQLPLGLPGEDPSERLFEELF